MDNVTVESLEKKFPGEGVQRFREIAEKGGFGDVPVSYEGGLDVRGVIEPDNKTFTDAQKSKLADLAGIDKAARERIERGETTGTPKTQKEK